MIEASVGALPGLLALYAVLSLVAVALAVRTARRRGRPALLVAAFTMAALGEGCVTLMPGSATAGGTPVCDTGSPALAAAAPEAWLNVALAMPATALGTVLWRRPVTVGAWAVAASAGVELAQAVLGLGRSCTLTDVAANSAGALLGTGTGCLVLAVRRQGVARAGRDVVVGAAVLCGAGLVLGTAFATLVEGEDQAGALADRQARGAAMRGAEEWATALGEDLFGEGLTVTGSVTRQTAAGQVRVTLSTDRGEIIGAWPGRELVRAWAVDARGRPGPLDEPGAVATADRILNEHLPAHAPGPDVPRQALALGGDGTHGPTAYLVSYGSTAPGAASSLDVTLSADGRLIGIVTHPHPGDGGQPAP